DVLTAETFASERMRHVLNVPEGGKHRTRRDLMSAHVPYHPDDRERISQMTREVLAGSALHHEFEYRLLRGPEHEIRWIRSRWKLFRDAQGAAQRGIGVVRGVTG